MKVLQKITLGVLAIIAGFFIAIFMWIFHPAKIMQRWSNEIHKKSFDAFFLYYSGIVLSVFGIWKLFELL